MRWLTPLAWMLPKGVVPLVDRLGAQMTVAGPQLLPMLGWLRTLVESMRNWKVLDSEIRITFVSAASKSAVTGSSIVF